MINKAQDLAVKRLFAGVDAERHTVPAELIDARARVTRMDSAVAALRPHVAEQAARAAALLAALDDPDADVTGPILAAQAADAASKIRAEILRTAQAAASDELTSTVHAYAETIFAEHLRPKLGEVVDQAKKAHAVYSPHGGDERRLFNAPPKVRAAFGDFAAAADAFEALCAARGALLDFVGRAVQDANGYFAQIRNVEEVWPELLSSKLPQSTLTRPWPTEGSRTFLAWAIEAGAELWLPTGPEQDQRWTEVFGERVKQHQRNNQALTQYRQLAVG